MEVRHMLSAAAWLILSGMLQTLRLSGSGGSFPKPLSAQEERHYLELAAQGDLAARNVLIERNLRLVTHIMKKYYTSSADQEDLISIGTIGLIKGISTFDGSKGARLATYAARCVENAILSPMGFMSCIRPSKAQNGGFWRRFPRLFISFVPLWIPMCGMPPSMYTGSV